MTELLVYIVSLIVIPILLLLIFLEKRARRIMLSFLSGVLVCLAAYFINTTLYKIIGLSNDKFSYLIAPIDEEILKFIPLLLFCIILKKGPRQTIAMSFALGVGFCVVENFFYLINALESANIGWVIVRCIGTGLMHSMTTTFIGFGLYKARTTEHKLWPLIVIVTVLIAIIYHGTYNFITSITKIRLIGVFIPLISYIVVSLLLKKDAIKAFLEEKESSEETNEEPSNETRFIK